MYATAQLFKSLSEEIRLRIMALLMEGELCVCDLIAVLDLPQSTISRHLAYLRSAGLIEGERRGVWMYYRPVVTKEGLHKDLLKILSKHLNALPIIKSDQQALNAYLAVKETETCS